MVQTVSGALRQLAKDLFPADVAQPDENRYYHVGTAEVN